MGSRAEQSPPWLDYNMQFSRLGPDATDPDAYQTKLPPNAEKMYLKWFKSVKQQVGHDLDPNDLSYDMRGFWRDVVATGQFKSMGKDQHFPDTYKTPYHATFSNQSVYATPDAPYWNAYEEHVDPLTGSPTEGFKSEQERGND